ncbi:Sec23 domain-containing protein [Hamiltosporidium magnivora]|uniref:Sec23 domain-containing protein n=3 Tax=Hamiltosporidium TaxID=1176354 RepID=A0A4Q9LLJ1_9MICR|nr:Sec23 domain-containing protein [Hamiltosporidium magnivora]
MNSPIKMHKRNNIIRDGKSQVVKDFPKGYATSQQTKTEKIQNELPKPEVNAPSLPSEVEKDQKIFFSFDTSSYPPPLSTTDFFVTETKNTDPNLLRSSFYVIPAEPSIFQSINLPLTTVLQPFNSKALINEIENIKSVRCMECLAYVNIFTKIDDLGKYFKCNICNASVELKGIITKEDPILRFSTLDYLKKEEEIIYKPNFVDSEYFNYKFYKRPIFIFCIELTSSSISTGLFDSSLDSLESVLLNRDFSILYESIAIFIFGREIKNFCFENEEVAEYVITDDINTPFVSTSLLISLDSEFYDLKITKLFEVLRNLKSKDSISCLKNMLNVSCMLSCMTPGAITLIYMTHLGQIGDFSYLSNNITEMTSKFLNSSNSLFISSLEKTTDNPLIRLCFNCNGNYNFYKNLFELRKLLVKDVNEICLKQRGFNISIETRTSDSIRKSSVYANTSSETTLSVFISQMSDSDTVAFSFYIDESVKENTILYLQITVNFIDNFGIQKVRVFNHSFISSYKIATLYNNLCFDTIFCSFVKFLMNDTENLKKNLENIKNMLIKSLQFYRTSCSSQATSTQLVLPESIKLLPVLFQSLEKHKFIANEISYSDFRKIINFSVQKNLRFFYPRLFSLTDYFVEENLKKVNCLRLSSQNINSNEIYILENSLKIYIYVGRQVEKELIISLKIENLEDLNFYNFCTENGENENISEEALVLKNMIKEIKECYDKEMEVVVIKQGNGQIETEFLENMVEDKLNNVGCYGDYLCDLHFKIQKW